MDITVKTKDLTKALAQAQKHCYKSRRRWYEALEGIKLEAIDNKLYLIATNFDVKYLTSIDCEVKKEGIAIVKSPKALGAILKNTKSSTTVIRKIKEDIVILGDEIYQLDTYDAKDYPLTVTEFEIPEETFALHGKAIKEAIEKTLPMVAKDKTMNANLLGQYWIDSANSEVIKFIGTDGFKMTIVEIHNYNTIKPITVLSRAAKELKNFANTNKYLTLWMDNNSLYANIDNETLAVKITKHDLPDYKKVIDKTGTTIITIQKSILKQTIEKLMLCADEKHHTICGEISKNTITLYTEKNKKLIDIEKQGVDVDIKFNGQLLLDILNVMQSEIVKLEFVKDEQCLITGAFDEKFIGTFMLMFIL